MAVKADSQGKERLLACVQDPWIGGRVGGGQIPQARRAIETSCGQPVLVGAEGDRTDSALMAAQDPWIGGRVGGSQIPQARNIFINPIDQPMIIGTDHAGVPITSTRQDE